MRNMLIICAVLASLLSEGAIRTQTFDGKSPEWKAAGAGSQWLKTQFAGGAAPGEASIQPANNEKCFYADTQIGKVDLDQNMEASGRIIWRMNDGEGSSRGVHFGFFDKDSFSTFVGLGFHGGGSRARAFIIHEKSIGAIAVNRQQAVGTVTAGTHAEPNNTGSYPFSIYWQASGGAAGQGVLTVTVDGIGSASVELTPAERAAFTSSLNAFGFFVPDGAGANSQFMADDLKYSFGEERIRSAPAVSAAQHSAPKKRFSKPPISGAAVTTSAKTCTGEFITLSGTQTGFEPLSDDLVNAGSPDLKAVVNEGYTPTPAQFGSLSVINDGKIGAPSVPADGLLQTTGSYGMVFELNTDAHPEGYRVDEIRVIAAWEEQRAAQHVAAAVRLVGADVFTEIGTFKQPPFGGKHNSSLLTVKGEGGALATGVAAVRIRMLPIADDPASNYGVYREVDVLGVPSADGQAPVVARSADPRDRIRERQAAETEIVRAAAAAFRPVPGAPKLQDFFVPGIPTQDPETKLFPYDAPTITNHRLWGQAVTTEGRSGILDMEDVWAGSETVEGTMRYTLKGLWGKGRPLRSTVQVKANGVLEKPPTVETADWLPNAVIRHAEHGGLKYKGTVKTAAGYMAFLNLLEVENPGTNTVTVDLEVITGPASADVAIRPQPSRIEQHGEETIHYYDGLNVSPGAKKGIGLVLAYREPEGTADALVADFSKEWKLADSYWNALLADAFDSEPGPFLSGGVPRFETSDDQEKKFYEFGVVSALMVMTAGPDRISDSNLYLVAMPDAPYSRWIYFWDTSYAAETLALMDPKALREMLKLMCASGIQQAAALDHVTGKPAAQWYAANFGAFCRLLSVYIDWTGDASLLDVVVDGKSVLDHALVASGFNDARPQRGGLFNAGTEHNLFDRGTVAGYEHFVAFPNMADVWGKRQIARLLELKGRVAEADELRSKADARAQAVIINLYNSAPGYEGTWKQIHENGKMLQIRHGIDFMHGGVALNKELSPLQKEQMVDWFRSQILNQSSGDDVWIICQDRRDGNNGWHQMEHNGNGAYPGWPYHFAWSLHSMGYYGDVQAVLDRIKGITKMGAIGQGYLRDGRRSRSGWVEIAGAFPVPYFVNLVFGLDPSGNELTARPLPAMKPGASLEGLRWRGAIYDVAADGTISEKK